MRLTFTHIEINDDSAYVCMLEIYKIKKSNKLRTFENKECEYG